MEVFDKSWKLQTSSKKCFIESITFILLLFDFCSSSHQDDRNVALFCFCSKGFAYSSWWRRLAVSSRNLTVHVKWQHRETKDNTSYTFPLMFNGNINVIGDMNTANKGNKLVSLSKYKTNERDWCFSFLYFTRIPLEFHFSSSFMLLCLYPVFLLIMVWSVLLTSTLHRFVW